MMFRSEQLHIDSGSIDPYIFHFAPGSFSFSPSTHHIYYLTAYKSLVFQKMR